MVVQTHAITQCHPACVFTIINLQQWQSLLELRFLGTIGRVPHRARFWAIATFRAQAGVC